MYLKTFIKHTLGCPGGNHSQKVPTVGFDPLRQFSAEVSWDLPAEVIERDRVFGPLLRKVSWVDFFGGSFVGVLVCFFGWSWVDFFGGSFVGVLVCFFGWSWVDFFGGSFVLVFWCAFLGGAGWISLGGVLFWCFGVLFWVELGGFLWGEFCFGVLVCFFGWILRNSVIL